MTYDRRNPPLRKQYDALYNCIYNCPNDDSCINYVYYNKKDCCVWQNVINSDVDKIKNLEQSLTFPIIETVLKRGEK